MIRQMIFSAGLLISLIFFSFQMGEKGLDWTSGFAALALVAGGTSAVGLLVYPWKRFVWTIRLVRKTFRPLAEPQATILSITHLARSYRLGWDIRNLEKEGRTLPPGLLKTGVELIAFQSDRNQMKEVLKKEADFIQEQYENAGRAIRHLSRAALSLGLVATAVHFTRFYAWSPDPQAFTGYAPLSFLGILYGVLLGKLVLAPLADRMKEYGSEERVLLDLIQEGILGIRDGEHPRAIRFRLESGLAAGGVMGSIPGVPDIEIPRPEEVALESKGVGSILVN